MGKSQVFSINLKKRKNCKTEQSGAPSTEVLVSPSQPSPAAERKKTGKFGVQVTTKPTWRFGCSWSSHSWIQKTSLYFIFMFISWMVFFLVLFFLVKSPVVCTLVLQQETTDQCSFLYLPSFLRELVCEEARQSDCSGGGKCVQYIRKQGANV